MKIRLEAGHLYWLAATSLIALFTLFVVGRNVVHVVRIKRQISRLQDEERLYRERIAADSTLIEHLRYDDYLEEYARERFRMRRAGDHVYIMED